MVGKSESKSIGERTNKFIIAVVGAADASDTELRIAEEVGREIARRGFVLLCGGLGGVMEAACRGAAAEGGLTVGILPGRDKTAANPYCKLPIATGLGEARNAIVATAPDAVCAVGGRLGTLSEIAFALKRGKPVVSIAGWSLDEERCLPFRLLQASSVAEAFEILVNKLIS